MAEIYCFISDESFLLQENRLIEINKLKNEGYLNRKIYFVDKRFNWDTFDSNESLSLFEDKELLDLRINGFAPTKDCLNYLEDFSCKEKNSKTIILSIENVTKVKGSAWYKKISSIAKSSHIEKVYPNQFPAWLKSRAKRRGLDLDAQMAEYLTELTNGNLLAADQELKCLKLISKNEDLKMITIKDSLIDSSSKDIFSFSRSFINSNVFLFNKLLNQLLIEKVPLTLILWSLNRELSFIEALQTNPTMKVPGPFDYVSDLKNSAKTLSKDSINKIKLEIAKLDRLIKSENNEKLIKVHFNTLMSYVL